VTRPAASLVEPGERRLAKSKLRRIALWIVCAKVALVPVIFDPGSDIPFAVVKDVISHALAYALAGVLAALFVQFGRGLVVRSVLHIPVLAFLLVSVAATLFAADPILALYGARGRMLGLATIADGVLLYFAIVLLVRTRADALWILLSAFGGSVLVLGYELVQFVDRDPFHWDISGALRPFSTIGQTTNLAEYLSVLALGAIALALLDAQLRRNTRLLLALLASALIVGVIPTLVRSAFLGIAAGMALLVLLTWLLHPSRRARRLTLLGALAAGAVLGAIVIFTPLGARLLNTVEISASADNADDSTPRLEQSADVRLALYQVALEMVQERPLLGYGPDNFAVGLPTYRTDHEPQEVSQGLTTSAHGWVTQVASGGGLLGLIAFAAAALVAVWLTFRAGFRPVAWASATMLVTFLGAGLTTVNGVATDWMFWASLGLVGATTLPSKLPAPAIDPASKPSRHRQSLPARPQPALRRGAAVGAVAIGVLMMFTPINALSASHSSYESTRLRLRSQPEQAAAAALRATGSDPLRAQYWDTLGLAYVSGDHLSEAASAFSQANKLAPYDVRFHGDLARVYVVMFQRGDKTAGARAHEVGEQAVRIDPNNPLANHTRAVAMQVTGDYPEALKSVERAIALDRYNNQGLYVTAAQVLLGLGRPADAVTMALRGIAVVPDPRNQVPIRTELVRSLAANGQLAEALIEARNVLAIQPGEPTVQKLVAQIQAAMGK
jgi:O-antigen ligase/Flp pilus assembly protein TadD